MVCLELIALTVDRPWCLFNSEPRGAESQYKHGQSVISRPSRPEHIVTIHIWQADKEETTCHSQCRAVKFFANFIKTASVRL